MARKKGKDGGLVLSKKTTYLEKFLALSTSVGLLFVIIFLAFFWPIHLFNLLLVDSFSAIVAVILFAGFVGVEIVLFLVVLVSLKTLGVKGKAGIAE